MKGNAASGALLVGRLFDDRGNRMSPSFSTKRGVRYNFYVSSALLRKGTKKAGSLGRASAPELEAAVIDAVKAHVPDHATDLAGRALVQTHVAQVIFSKDRLKIDFARPPNTDGLNEHQIHGTPENSAPNQIVVPWSLAHKRPFIEIDERATSNGSKPNPIFVQAIARAHAWMQQLSSRTCASIEALAAKNDIHPKAMRQAIRLAFLSPQITAMFLRDEQPASLNLAMLHDAALLAWSEQWEGVGRAR